MTPSGTPEAVPLFDPMRDGIAIPWGVIPPPNVPGASGAFFNSPGRFPHTGIQAAQSQPLPQANVHQPVRKTMCRKGPPTSAIRTEAPDSCPTAMSRPLPFETAKAVP